MLARSRACGRGAAGTWLYESSGSTTRRKQNQEESLLMASNLYTALPMWTKTTCRRYPISARYFLLKNSNDAFRISSHPAPGPRSQIVYSVASVATTLTTRHCKRSCDLRRYIDQSVEWSSTDRVPSYPYYDFAGNTKRTSASRRRRRMSILSGAQE